ncbi:pleiotropic regulatory protein RsmS [Pantoea sp. Fr+CA_20]|jgi:hypothetical protein|uniref:pleiotropic regulatory protein RsmS n=1 Tax=Pantoea TaxID=53335 RepID=UPI0021195BAE|nr:pleiotropic regulatory protein RsmS [Pantoea sp. Fr+CA_20]
MSLDTAPEEVKLAVDLIQLFEENQFSVETVLSALAIVQRDYERKRDAQRKD